MVLVVLKSVHYASPCNYAGWVTLYSLSNSRNKIVLSLHEITEQLTKDSMTAMHSLTCDHSVAPETSRTASG